MYLMYCLEQYNLHVFRLLVFANSPGHRQTYTMSRTLQKTYKTLYVYLG